MDNIWQRLRLCDIHDDSRQKPRNDHALQEVSFAHLCASWQWTGVAKVVGFTMPRSFSQSSCASALVRCTRRITRKKHCSSAHHTDHHAQMFVDCAIFHSSLQDRSISQKGLQTGCEDRLLRKPCLTYTRSIYAKNWALSGFPGFGHQSVWLGPQALTWCLRTRGSGPSGQ